ncbi:MAG: hypothetical protein ACLPN1_08740 [Dissulfurispiraceae bacterium]|jgi:hypothetical protein
MPGGIIESASLQVNNKKKQKITIAAFFMLLVIDIVMLFFYLDHMAIHISDEDSHVEIAPEDGNVRLNNALAPVNAAKGQ